MADFGGEPDGFRATARTWLEENFPASLRRDSEKLAETLASPQALSGDAELWRQRMAEKGWGTPTWPQAYGGGGLSTSKARILAEEMRRIGAPNPIGGMGVIIFGPTLL